MALGTGAILAFCQCSKELSALNEDARERMRVVREERKATQAVLREVLLSGGDELVDSRGYVVSCGGITYRVRPRQVKPTAPRPTSDNVESVLQLWEDSSVVKAALESFSGLEPAAALVSFVLEVVNAKTSKKQPDGDNNAKWKVEVTPYRPKGEKVKGGESKDDDPPPPPPQGTNVDELVDTLLRARESCQTMLKETKEVREAIEVKRDEAAEEVLPQLQALPTEKKVQKINLRDSAGNSEAFYLRVKPPLKPRLTKRIGVADYKAALRTAAEDTVKRFCLDGFRLPTLGSTREFGEQFCSTLQEMLAAKEHAAMEKAIKKNNNSAKQRIALDRVRSARSGSTLN